MNTSTTVPTILHPEETLLFELNKGQYDFYQVELGSVRITITLTVQQGEIVWFYSTDQSQSQGNGGWTEAISWYKDFFVDPIVVNQSDGNTIYITLMGNALHSSAQIEASYEDTSTKGIY